MFAYLLYSVSILRANKMILIEPFNVQTQTHVIAIGWTSVCPSVTRWYCVKTAQPIVLSSLPDSPIIMILVF